MAGPSTLTATELAAISDPATLLRRAQELEPSLRLSERAAMLDRLEEVLRSDAAPEPPPGRDWRLEGLAERAVDATSHVELDVAARLVDQILAEAEPDCELAIVRALSARARALAWTGTEQTVHEADQVFLDAIERCRALGHRDWLGQLLCWRSTTIFFQNGQLERAAELMSQALNVLGEESPRRSGILTFSAEIRIAIGEWDAVREVLDDARTVADRDGDGKSRAYVAWCRAQLASLQGEALATERLLREVERDGGDWFEMDTGVTFLAEAAEMLDRVGSDDAAQEYLARAIGRGHPDDHRVHQARATLLARSGDPWQGLEALQRLSRGDSIERRLLWRHMLLGAWATFRAGRGDAGALAAQALEQARRTGGIRVAAAGEPEILDALAPLAALAGSAPARERLLDGRRFLVWLSGTPRVLRSDGATVSLPRGRPAELVRMLALHEHGLPVEVVLENFFAGAPAASARHRLRQVLLRLRTTAEDLVTRDGDHLTLAPAWVDIRAFLLAADRMRATPGSRGVRFAHTALATMSGPLLPADTYADWAQAARDDVEYRRLTILDRIVSDAVERRSHQEAITALEAIIAHRQVDPSYHATLRAQLLTLGQVGTASYLQTLADAI